MNAIGEPPEKPARKSRRRNRILAIVGGAAVLIAVWLTGIPQERVTDWGLEYFLRTGVQLKYSSVYGALHIDTLSLFPGIDERGLAVIQISDLTIDYDLFPKDGRWIREVVIGKLAIRLDATDPANPNFAFINRLLAQDDSEPLSKSVIPKIVRINSIALAMAGQPQGTIDGQPFQLIGLSIAGLHATAEIDGERITQATLAGDGITTRTWTGLGAPAAESNHGRIQIAFHADAKSSRLDTIVVDLPGLLEIHGTAFTAHDETVGGHRIEIATLKIGGAGFNSDTMPIAFEHIDASGITIDSNSESPWDIPCTVTGLRVGDAEHPLYQGDLQLSVKRRAESDIELTIGLNEGQQIYARFDPENGSVVASVDAWTLEMLTSAVPPAYRDRLTELPDFRNFSLTLAASAPNVDEWLEGTSQEPMPFDFSIFGDAALVQDSKEGGIRIEAAGNGTWTSEGFASAVAHGGITIAGERAEFGVERGADESISANVSLDDVKVGRWLTLAFGDIPVGSDSGTLNGTLTYDGSTGGGDLTLSRGEERATLSIAIAGAAATSDDPLRVTAIAESGGTATLNYEASGETWNGTLEFTSFDLGRLARLVGFEGDFVGTATGHANVSRNADAAHGDALARLENVRSDDWSLNPEAPIEVAIAFESDADFQSVQGSATRISLGGETIVSIDRWDWTQDPWQFNAKAEATLDLGKHGKAFGIEGWGGQAQASLSIDHQQDRWQAPVHVVWNNPQFPGLEEVNAGPITIEGNLARQANATATTLTNGNVTWGEHTRVSLPHAAIETSPFGVVGDVKIETDLTLLIALGVLQYVDGAMNAEGEIRLIDGNPQFDLNIDADIAALELPDSIAAAYTAHVTGQISYDGRYGGAGTFNAASASSAGALLTDIAGGYAFTGDRLSLSDVSGQLYGGKLLGQGQVELLTGTYNGEFQADINRLDLDRFTKEFEPGEFRFTGISDGEVYARWSTVGLSGARFTLTSTEGFSLDRETVETMLTTSALPDQWGMRWIRKRINKKMIGTEPQRPFDSARVDLELRQTDGEPDRLLGPISLKSETLDFNIDWTVDVNAIYAAMESDLAAVENFSVGTVQSTDQ